MRSGGDARRRAWRAAAARALQTAAARAACGRGRGRAAIRWHRGERRAAVGGGGVVAARGAWRRAERAPEPRSGDLRMCGCLWCLLRPDGLLLASRRTDCPPPIRRFCVPEAEVSSHTQAACVTDARPASVGICGDRGARVGRRGDRGARRAPPAAKAARAGSAGGEPGRGAQSCGVAARPRGYRRRSRASSRPWGRTRPPGCA